ncbi:bola protein [Chaetomidium leptoderma]|uniref:Bola protein n=1 Tax=Chaetomidium leptoderma TaxID=669021 RepID=A0AAN6VTW6_9PEZI|nr:bola protein [Chaetomidium leptoderma]
MAETAITEDSVRAALTERLKATHVEIQDMSGGCGQAFTSLIVSPEFAGKNSLKRHRLVNAALKVEIAQIHAWSAKCQTPEEYDKEMAATGGNDKPPMDGTEGGKVTGVNE